MDAFDSKLGIALGVDIEQEKFWQAAARRISIHSCLNS
jgi:hypothetical protein